MLANGKTLKIYNQSAFGDKDFTNRNMSRAIYEDANGRYWVSVANQGVGELNLQTGKIAMLRDKHPEIGFHRKNFGFYPVDEHTFATFGESGIYYYDTQNDKIFIPEIDIKSGMSNNSIESMKEDDNGAVWVTSANGITKIEVAEGDEEYKFSLVNFDTHDGLQSGKFFEQSSLKTKNGDLYFGGYNGFNTFNPDKIVYP